VSDAHPQLSPQDIAALDAIIESGLDLAQTDGRAARVASILRLLDGAPIGDRTLADVTFARVMQARRQSVDPELGEDDQEALEAWVMHGYDALAVPASLRERARRHQALMAAATDVGPVPPAEANVERTLAHVQAWINREAETMTFGRPRRIGGARIRMADLLSVAAVVLIGCSVVFPVLSAAREKSRRALCNANLGNTALAMSSYAGSNRDALPMANASLGGGRWWDVAPDSTTSNSSNLYTLARDKYTTLASLACPGNPNAPTAPANDEARDWRRLEEVSYSYQIMFAAPSARPNWSSGPRTVVLADRSPVVLRASRGEDFDPFANAPNHGGVGQHVLSNDGSVQWCTTPVRANGDNIWLPRSIEVHLQRVTGRSPSLAPITGQELPASPDDTVLGP
jgi:hypothetical protein